MDTKEKNEIIKNLESHLDSLTKKIGERSVRHPGNLERTAAYIESYYNKIGIRSWREPYDYKGMKVDNIAAELTGGSASKTFILGAHYDSVSGSVGADDNASAVAVQLETARLLAAAAKNGKLDMTVRLISFALEEPPAYGTKYMGSRVYARKAKENKERIDGMICLEMVGFTCRGKGCQGYPLPLRFMDYPSTGDFIAVVGDNDSMEFTKTVYSAFQRNRNLPVVKLNVPLKGNLLPTIRLSDHASFWDAGYKAVMITDTAFYRNPNYHHDTDTMETLDFRFMGGVVESLMLFFTDSK